MVLGSNIAINTITMIDENDGSYPREAPVMSSVGHREPELQPFELMVTKEAASPEPVTERTSNDHLIGI